MCFQAEGKSKANQSRKGCAEDGFIAMFDTIPLDAT